MKQKIHPIFWKTTSFLVLAHLACAGTGEWAEEKAALSPVKNPGSVHMHKGASGNSMAISIKNLFPCFDSEAEADARARRKAQAKLEKKQKKEEEKRRKQAAKTKEKLRKNNPRSDQADEVTLCLLEKKDPLTLGKKMEPLQEIEPPYVAETSGDRNIKGDALLGKTYPRVGPGNTLSKAITSTVKNKIGDLSQPAGQESIPVAADNLMLLINRQAASSNLMAEVNSLRQLTRTSGTLSLREGLVAQTQALDEQSTVGNLGDATERLQTLLGIDPNSPSMSVAQAVGNMINQNNQLIAALADEQASAAQWQADFNLLSAYVDTHVKRLVAVGHEEVVPELKDAVDRLLTEVADPSLAVRPLEVSLVNVGSMMGFNAHQSLEGQTKALKTWVAVPASQTTVYFPKEENGPMLPYKLTTQASGSVMQALQDTMSRCNPVNWKDEDGNPLPDRVNIMMTGFFKDQFDPSRSSTFGQTVGSGAIKPSYSFPNPTATSASFV